MKGKSEFNFPSFETRSRNQTNYYQLSRRESYLLCSSFEKKNYFKYISPILKEEREYCHWNYFINFILRVKFQRERETKSNFSSRISWAQHRCQGVIGKDHWYHKWVLLADQLSEIFLCFEASVQLVPTMLFTSCQQTAWTAIDFL